jgi:hypothetical protein
MDECDVTALKINMTAWRGEDMVWCLNTAGAKKLLVCYMEMASLGVSTMNIRGEKICFGA